MPRGKKTDSQMIANIMTSYALTNSYNATAKELGISDSTVKKIIEGNKEEFGKVQEQKKDEFINKASRLIDKALIKLDKELDKENIPINNLTTVIGTLYDKRALAKGDSTNNDNFTINVKVTK